MAKHIVGKDGKSARGHRLGKPIREEALEFRECQWRRPRTRRVTTCSWSRGGGRMGRRWWWWWRGLAASSSTPRTARCTRCGPCSADLSRIHGRLRPCGPRRQSKGSSGSRRKFVIRTPSRFSRRQRTLRRWHLLPPPHGRAPNRVFADDAGLHKFGYTAGCSRCMHMRAGVPCRGIKHREACRARIEAHLRAAGGPRIVAADSRWASRAVAHGNPGAPPRRLGGHSAGSGTGGDGGEPVGGGPAPAGVLPVVDD